MQVHPVAEASAQFGGEVVDELGADFGVVRQTGREYVVHLCELRVGQQDGELGSCQAQARGLTLGELFVGGQVLEAAIDASVVLEGTHVARVDVHHVHRLRPRERQCQILRPVVPEHGVGDLRRDAPATSRIVRQARDRQRRPRHRGAP